MIIGRSKREFRPARRLQRGGRPPDTHYRVPVLRAPGHPMVAPHGVERSAGDVLA